MVLAPVSVRPTQKFFSCMQPSLRHTRPPHAQPRRLCGRSTSPWLGAASAACGAKNDRGAMSESVDRGAAELRLTFIRHGQAEHNAAFLDGLAGGRILDPQLTSLGEAQARGLRADGLVARVFADDPPELIVVSPLRRALQTAWLGFGGGLPCLAIAELQETHPSPCDTGDPALALAFARSTGPDGRGLVSALESLPAGWHEKSADYADERLVQRRWRTFLQAVASRPERSILVLGHHNVFAAGLCHEFANCEARRYVLDRDSLSLSLLEEPTLGPLPLWLAGLPLAYLFLAAGYGHFAKEADFVGTRRRTWCTPTPCTFHTVHRPRGALLSPRTMCGYRWASWPGCRYQTCTAPPTTPRAPPSSYSD